jgi:hypothetical protein
MRSSAENISKKDKNNGKKYVQAPVMDEKTALSFVNCFTSSRNNRARSRSMVQIRAIGSETKRPPECPNAQHDSSMGGSSSTDVEASCHRVALPSLSNNTLVTMSDSM